MPYVVGIGPDFLVRAAAEHRPWVVLRVPALDGMLVALVQQHPRVSVVAVPAHKHEPATQLRPVYLSVQLTRLERGTRVVGLDWLPGAGGPDDDVTSAVLLGRDHALEVEVLDRMVLHAHRQPPHLRVEWRTLRDGPAHEDPVHLEPQVVVQPAGPMSLHHEPGPCRSGRDLACWLRGALEVSLATVGRQQLAHAATSRYGAPGQASLPVRRPTVAWPSCRTVRQRIAHSVDQGRAGTEQLVHGRLVGCGRMRPCGGHCLSAEHLLAEVRQVVARAGCLQLRQKVRLLLLDVMPDVRHELAEKTVELGILRRETVQVLHDLLSLSVLFELVIGNLVTVG